MFSLYPGSSGTRPLFSRRAQKASPEPPRRKSIRCALMPSTPMRQYCRFRWVTVRFIFNISPSAWRNATVQGSSSISQTTPITTSTHLGPKSTAPRPLHCRSQNCPSNWCQRQFGWTARLWLGPDHEMHSEQSNFDACWKKRDFNALISECLDLKEGVSIQPFCWCTTPNQKNMQIYWRSHYAKRWIVSAQADLLSNGGITSAGRMEHYHYEASNTFHLNFATTPIPNHPQQEFQWLSYWSSKLNVFNSL